MDVQAGFCQTNELVAAVQLCFGSKLGPIGVWSIVIC